MKPYTCARIWRGLLTPVSCAVLAAVLAAGQLAQAEAPDTKAPQAPKTLGDYTINTVAEGLNLPWAMAFLPDGRLLVSERSGALRLVKDGAVSAPLTGVPATYFKGQGGLHDLKLHPDYANNGWVYLSFAWGSPKENALRLVRGRVKGEAFVDVEEVFTATPLKDTPVHYGGRLDFLPDGTLVMGIGDGYNYREDAQKTDSLLGKVVRIHDDGRIPEDNPFVNQKAYHPAIYSLGHRNPQGMAYDAKRKLLLSNEHGPKGGDEINILAPGKNYGWPVITYGRDYSGASITPYTEYPGMEQPLVNWTPSIAPASLIVYSGKAFPAMAGDLLSSSLKFNEVRWVQMQGNQAAHQVALFKEVGARLRAVYEGPEGALYLLTDAKNGKILKVAPKGQ
ncbi:PQQ-dependent sugar dehydrogenase [Simiduia sp. 21SJ11W-1]|uniref:PQQ-dependent sugar dehydrogenase n=1 Tax=Simiduia sp. 21SJ11W-1 TaxID=2909669 RepID=UPI0020A064A9|nr:PQQ-dependent sugar dehydrogenase [Simiduia sp. 21SJ11W-1]UTA46853.1 PQQ-dependent sugar dehydrogenase [Simiduia sp. 21SJ11W-1]